MKILHTADFHLRLSQDKRYKKELVTILKFIVDTVETEKPNYLFIAGDVYDSKLPTPTEAGVVTAFLNRILRTGTKIVMIPGNHDTPFQRQYLNTLRSLENLNVEGLYVMSNVQILDFPDCRILGVPYVYEDKEATLVHIKELHDTLPTDKPIFSIIHSWVDKYLDVPFSDKEFNTSVDFLNTLTKIQYHALGHIHKGGQVTPNAWYAGSPFRITLGETEETKFLLKWEDGVLTKIPTPCLPLYILDVKEKQDVSGITDSICKINAKGITPELLGDVHALHDKLKEQNNYVYIDLELQSIQFETAQATKQQSFDEYLDDYVKRNDIVKFKDTYVTLCSKILSEQVNDKTTPFTIDELYPKGGKVNVAS